MRNRSQDLHLQAQEKAKTRDPGQPGHPDAMGLAGRDSAGPAEEALAGVSCGARDTRGGDRPGGVHRGWCHSREPQGSGPWSETGAPQGPPLAALAERGACAWGPHGPLSGWPSPQHTPPKVHLKEDPGCAPLGQAQPVFPDRTLRFHNMLVSLGLVGSRGLSATPRPTQTIKVDSF